MMLDSVNLVIQAATRRDGATMMKTPRLEEYVLRLLTGRSLNHGQEES